MSVARTADRRILVLLAIVVLAIVILSLISFEAVTHFATLWQMIHGTAYTQNGILPHHP